MTGENCLFDPTTERLDEINENLSLIQLKTGLTFGTDSYLLAAFSRSAKKGTMVEFGGGTGVVSLLCASREKFLHIHCVEIQPYFAELIGRNAEMNKLGHMVTSVCADVRELDAAVFGAEVSSVVSNPPYMMAQSGFDNATAEMNTARREENGTIDDFAESAARLLKFGGYFTVVYRPDRLSDLIYAMKKHSLEPKRMITVYPTAESKPCLVLVEAKKGAASGLVQSRPLIIYKEKNSTEYTADMQAVYDNFTLEHLF
ncbi:MAG: SAM-dependent methyltransferase [Ruminococcaceae bacterium]|nr:SAM-dependent methyltransferase [Oscillospiraceae bacterium]